MRIKVLIIGIFTFIIAIIGFNTGIFWDNTTFVSAMGNVLYENGIFAWGSIPASSDPGHPPFIATLLSAAWNIFGKSLLISHIVIIPFVLGLLWQIWNTCDYFIDNNKEKILAFLLVSADATLLSQMTLVTTEIPLLFFFFLALNGLLRKKYWLKALGLMLLGIVSLRGMMLCGGLFIVDIILNKRSIKWQPYVIGALPAITFIIWRLAFKGWIISNPESNWGEAFGYMVYSKTKNPDAAATFALFLLTLEGQKAFNNVIGGGIPCTREGIASGVWRIPYPEGTFNYDAFLVYPEAFCACWSECYVPPEISKIINESLMVVVANHLNNKKDYKDALRELEQTANERWETIFEEVAAL